jgi:membrane protease YdiL (CAAX protease family)
MTGGPSTPMLHKPMHPFAQLLALIGILVIAIIIGTFIGLIIVTAKYGSGTMMNIAHLKIDSPQTVSALWFLQFIGTTLPILITPIIFSYAVVRDPGDYMKNNFHFPPILVILVIVMAALAFPITEYLGNINEKMILPHSLKAVEQWMRTSEDEAAKISNSMMQMHGFGDMLFDLIFIGLLTAIVEEFLFRGCFQTIFIRWTKNTHAAVWITAILFSAFHQEFYSFLPRVFLGVMFGYFAAWSGSVWPAILGHFLNNGSVVVLTYMSQKGLIGVDPNDSHTFTNWGYIISFALTLALLIIYKYISEKWHLAHNGEELD